MNKTFKVVFNRARGALMVANEITSSIQKKGTKTVLAAALISALASGAYATDSDGYINGDFSFTESTTIRTETKTPDIVESGNRYYTFYDANGTYAYTGIAGTKSGEKTKVTVANGATLTIDGDHSGYSDLSWHNSVFLITALSGGTVETTGTIVGNVSIPGGKSKIIPNTPCGIYGNNGNITINGNLIATVQSGEAGSRGVDATNNSKVVFKGNTTNITVNNGTQNGNAAYGVYAHENGTVDFEGNTTLTVDGKAGINSFGALASEEEDGNSVINFKGATTIIDVTSGTGVSADSSSAAINFTGETVTINANSEKHGAQAIQTYKGGCVIFDAKATLSATTKGEKSATGVAILFDSPETESTGITFNDSLNITSRAFAADACGVLSQGDENYSPEFDDSELSEADASTTETTTRSLKVVGKTTMEVTSDKDAYGVLAVNNAKELEFAETEITVSSTDEYAYGIVASNNSKAVKFTSDANILVSTTNGYACGVLSGDNTEAVEFEDAVITVSSDHTFGAVRGIYTYQNSEDETQNDLVRVNGNLELTVNLNTEEAGSDLEGYGVIQEGGKVHLGSNGKTVEIGVNGLEASETYSLVTGACAFDGAHLTVEGSKADITVTDGNASYGVASNYSAVVDFNSEETNITVDNSKKTDAGYQFGVWTDYATTNFNGEANITVKANLFKYPGEDLSESEGWAVGLWTVGSAQVNFKEAATIDVSTVGADTTYGVVLTNYEEEEWSWAGSAAFQNALTVTSTAKTANAYGILNDGKTTEYVETETADGSVWVKTEYTGTDGELSVAGKTTITATSNSGNAYGLWAEDNGKTIALSDFDITSSSNYGNATGIYATKTEDDTADVLVSATGDVDINVAANKGSGTAYGVDLHGGKVSLGSEGKTVKITAATGSKAAAFNVTEGITFNEDEEFTEGETLSEGGTLNFGSADSRLASVHLKVDDGIGYIGLIDGKDSAVNIYADSYKQEGSAWGLGVSDGTLNMNVGSFESTTKHVAVNAQSNTGIVATTFSATTTNDDPSVANLQASNNATLNVTADTVTLKASKEENCGAISIPGHGTVNLTANKALSITGNIDAKYAIIDNKNVSATFNVTSNGTLSLDGSINIGAPTDDTFYSVKDFVSGANKSIFSRDTTVNVESEGAATFTGDINIWGNGSTFGEEAGEHIVSLELGDGSTINGNISVLGQGATTQTNAVTITATGAEEDLTFSGNITAKDGSSVNLDGGTYTVSKLDVDSTSSLTLTDVTLNLTDAEEESYLTLKGTTNVNTTLATAFAGFTQDEQKLVTATEDGISARLNITTDSDKTSSITIAEAFTFTGGLLDTMRDAYDEVTLLFKNATLKVDSGTEEKTSISTDLEVSDITGNGNVSIAAGKSLTLGSGKEESQSTIRSITLEADADIQNGATLATTNKAEVSVSEIVGNKYGTVSVSGESTLNATKISQTREIVVDGATLDATAIETSGVISLTNQAVYEGETLTISHSNDAADAVGFSAKETSTDETSAGISIDVTGDTSITVTSKEKAVSGLLLEGKNNTNLTGNVEISTESSNSVATGICMKGGIAQIGADGKTVKVVAKGTGETTALSASENANLTIKGKEISFDSTGVALSSQLKSTISVGDENTDTITLKAGETGIHVYGEDSKINLTAKTINVTSTGKYGILVQDYKELDETPENSASITINADTLNVKGSTLGLAAYDNGRLTINADLTLKAFHAISLRGNSIMHINMDGKHTAKIDGKIIFGTPYTIEDYPENGRLINSKLELYLVGPESYWRGSTYQMYKENGEYKKSIKFEGDPYHHINARNFNLTISDGAKWIATGDSLVSTVRLKGNGKVDASGAKVINVGRWEPATSEYVPGFRVWGTGNELILGADTVLNGPILMHKDSELITPLTTAFSGISIAEETKEAILDADNFKARLTINKDSKKSALLTINDVFTYTSDVLTAMTDAYEAITLHLTNATLKLLPTTEEKITTIATDIATSSITSDGEDALHVSLKEGKTLTLGVGETASQSNVGTISLTALEAEDGTKQGATLKATNNTTVTAEEVAGDSHGIVIVTEASTLEAGKVTGTKKIEVTNNSTLKATTIDSHGAIQLDAGSKVEVDTLTQGKATSTDAAVTLEENSHLTAGLMSDVKHLSLGNNTSLTLGSEKHQKTSTIEKITFNVDKDEATSATVKVAKATKAQVTAIEGNGNGTLHVAENSELEVDTIRHVAEVKVHDSDVKADEIHGNGETTVSVHQESTLEVETVKDLNKVEVTAGSTLQAKTIENVNEITLTGESAMEVHTLSATDASISVGEVDGDGAKLSVESLKMAGGRIFVDPLYGSGYGDSVLRIGSFESGTLNTGIVAGNGALVIIGATEAAANSAIDKIQGINTNQPFVYVAKPVTLGSNGYVVVNTNASTDTTADASTVVLTKGALVIDQSAIGDNPVFSRANAVEATSDTTIAVVNALADSTITLATNDDGTVTSVTGVESLTVLTDSPFITGVLNATSGTIALTNNVEGGVSTIASMGIQSMIRHADAVLAETIADRAATRESGLWVSVRGERYEQDDVGSGFKADVGYGAFGADFAPTEGTRLGVAVQYGHGKVKGNAYSVKNKFKDYSATLYGSAVLGDTGINLLGEVAYTQSKNDVSTSYHSALNQDLDAKMYSAGVTALKTFEVGNVNITPSVGVRVSRIETDAMKVGPTTIAKQKQTVVQVPVAVRLSSKAIETASGWSVTPRFKVAYIPTFGDKKIDIFGSKSTVLDTSPVQGSFGINFKKGGFSFDATAQCGVGNRGTSSIGGKIGLNYAF